MPRNPTRAGITRPAEMQLALTTADLSDNVGPGDLIADLAAALDLKLPVHKRRDRDTPYEEPAIEVDDRISMASRVSCFIGNYPGGRWVGLAAGVLSCKRG